MDTRDENNQRMQNERKRRELARKYGARFGPQNGSGLPPEIEAVWLESIEAFERQHAASRGVRLRDFVGAPETRPPAEVPADQIEAELDALLDRLAGHEVYVDFINEIEAREAYRFIVDDLLDEEIDDIRIPGLRLHFIYEEYYPGEDPGSGR